METFAMNERIGDLCLGLLLTKLQFPTTDLKDVVKKSLFCHKEMLVLNRDFLCMSKC